MKICITGFLLDIYNGYGRVCELVAKGLLKLGVDVSVNMDQEDPFEIDSSVWDVRRKFSPEDADVELRIHGGDTFLSMKGKIKVGLTFWELDVLPDSYIPGLKSVDMVISPSRHIFDLVKPHKYTVHIPIGVDPNEFMYTKDKSSEPFVFLSFGSLNHYHKNIDRALEAFSNTFKDGELVMYCVQSHSHVYSPRVDSRISIKGGIEPKRVARELMSYANCMVYPTSGEGYGLSPLESLMSGTPVLVPYITGCKDYISEDYPFLIEVDSMRHMPSFARDMPAPSVDSIGRSMRKIYEMRNDLEDIRRANFERVREDFHYMKMCESILSSIKSIT